MHLLANKGYNLTVITLTSPRGVTYVKVVVMSQKWCKLRAMVTAHHIK